VIKPPSIYTHRPNELESQYLKAAKVVAKDYPNYFPDATDLYPAKYHAQTNKLILGLVHLETPATPKVTNNINSSSLKRFSSLFWNPKTS
jgi:hypothetical protein